MKRIFLILLSLFCLFNFVGCTSINNKCDYIPPGTCWLKHCEIPKDPSQCRSDWSCGYYRTFHD